MKYIVYILIGLWSYRASALSIDPVLQNKLLDLEYRVYTGTSDSAKVAYIIDKIKIYTSIPSPEDALNELSRLSNKSLTQKQNQQKYYYQALNLKLNNNPAEAYLKLAFINEQELDSAEWRLNFMLLKYALLVENNKFYELKNNLSNYLKIKNDTIHLNELINLPDGVNTQDPNANYKASGYLPGLGLIKTNRWGAGITSFTLVGGMIAFSSFCYLNTFYIMGTATGLNWAHRFYKGGKRYSYNETLNSNNEKLQALQLKYKDLITKVFLN